MTKYSSDDLIEDWEFKIVRAEWPVFRKPQVFQQLLQEEARSGWQMVEKLDDMRVRFKRPPAARRRDAMLPPGVDAYRTHFGKSSRNVVIVITLLMLATAFVIGFLPLVMEESFAPEGMIAVNAGLILLVMVAILVFIRLRR